MKKPVDKALIIKFINNSCTPEETSRIRKFLQTPESNQIFEEILEERWKENSEYTLTDEMQLKNWEEKFNQKIEAYSPPVQKKSNLPIYFRYAAIWVILILSIGGYGIYHMQLKDRPIAMMESSAAAGKVVKVILPDSTVVFLNAASSLRYPERFDGKTREVILNGEAFFEVRHDKEHPFMVHADKLNIHVLGTSFNIRSYNNDDDIAVTVSTGKVGVTIPTLKASKASFLLPNRELIYQKFSGKLEIATVNPEDARAWESGSFVFNYETLATITRRLSRWYNVDFNFKNSQLSTKRFKLRLHNENLHDVMQALSTSGDGFEYKITGKQVTIK